MLFRSFARLETQAFADAGRDPSEAGLTVHRSVDLRYAGQSSDLTLPLEEADSARWVTALTRHFHEEHERTYGYSRPADTVNVVSVRLRLLAPAKSFGFADLGATFKAASMTESESTRAAYFGPHHGWCDAAVLTRARLGERTRRGPLIIEEYDTTVVIPPGWQADVDSLGNIRLEKR